MKAAMISLGSLSSKWTAEAMRKHFDRVDHLRLRKFEVSVGRTTEILYDGKPMDEYDCIVAKGSHRYADMLASITAFFRGKIYLPVRTSAFAVAHDKILTHIYLQKFNVPQPKTFLTSSSKAAKKILKKLQFPIIMKLPRGTQGKGVMFADSYESASSMLDTLDTLRQPFLIQEYIDTDGEDIRAIVVGDKVIASMKRKAADDEKRSNYHAGGKCSPYKVDMHTQKVAVAAAKAIGAEICGVDILETIKGPVVLEVNLSPGLQGIVEATKIDIPAKIAKYVADKTKEYKKEAVSKDQKKIIDDLNAKNGTPQDIVCNIDFRGNRILLPEVITNIVKISEDDEMVISAKRDTFTVKRFMT